MTAIPRGAPPRPAAHGSGWRATAPGKLYVFGEYAVVAPGHHAIIAAVDRAVEAIARPVSHSVPGRIHTPGRPPLHWRHGVAGVEHPDPGFYSYATSALRVVDELRQAQGLPPRTLDIQVLSHLVDETTGRKIGLGSSGAVTVAVLGATAAATGISLDDKELLKAALVASARVSTKTSGGDIAAAAVGGYLDYSSPDLEEASRRAATPDLLAALVAGECPGLAVHALNPRVELRAGWTGSPADSHDLVRRAGALSPRLLERSDRVVSAFRARCAAPGPTASDLSRLVSEARAVLREISPFVETAELGRLVEAARDAGWAAKPSGAGGGDCGIALAPSGEPDGVLRQSWRAAGIAPLPIRVSPIGLKVEKL